MNTRGCRMCAMLIYVTDGNETVLIEAHCLSFPLSFAYHPKQYKRHAFRRHVFTANSTVV